MLHRKVIGSRPALVCIGALFGGIVASHVQAQLLYVDFSHSQGDGTTVTDHREGTSGTIAHFLNIGSTLGEASAQFGKLRAKSQASWSGISPPDPLRFAFKGASSTGGWQDELTISAPVPPGTQGHVVVRLGVNGIMSALENGEAGWTLDVDLTGGPSLDVRDQFFGSCFGPWHGIPCDATSANFGTFTTIPFTFQFGSPFSLEVMLNASAAGQQILDGSAAADLSNSLTWLGFAEVLDENQDPVTEFTVVSASGFDWSQPFSEPPPVPALSPVGIVTLLVLLPSVLMVLARQRKGAST